MALFPMARIGVVSGSETRRVDGAAGVRIDRRVGVTALTHTARFGDVDHHREKPSAQRGSALEVVDALEDRYPRFLDHLFGDFAARQISAGHPQHGGRVLVDESGERGFVTVAQSGDQRRFVHGRNHGRFGSSRRARPTKSAIRDASASTPSSLPGSKPAAIALTGPTSGTLPVGNAKSVPCTAIGMLTPVKPSGRTASRMVPDARCFCPAIKLSATPRSWRRVST